MNNDIKTFRIVRSYQVTGIIFLAASIGLLFAPLAPYEIFKYIFAALLGIPGIYCLLAFCISRVSLYPEKIVYYSFTGRREVFLWSGITSALIYYTYTRFTVDENICLYAGNKKITVDKRFKNFESMKVIIKEKCAGAFPVGKVENGGTQTLRIDNGAHIAAFCFIPFGVILGYVFITSYQALDSHMFSFCLVGSVFFTFMGFVQLLLWLFSRVYINAQSITHINMFGIKKQLMWPEITSATFNSTDIRSPGVRLSGGGKTIKLNRNYLRFEGVEDIIRKYSLGR